VSSEQKWGRFSGLVMLLPHGLEGQGPEHSSARPERFLQACAKDNIQVVNVTTPANYFHLLRRQTMRRVRKPLIVMAPKSLLRHAEAVSSLDDLADGAFQRVIADPEPPAEVERIVLCSGKLYYELRSARAAEPVPTIIHRVEMLYPFPADDIAELLSAHPAAHVVWCQEEPKNMGAWPRLFHWFYESFPDRRVEFVGRPDAPSPAGGSHRVDRALQNRVIRCGLGLS
jgi:2-oxoglutarate dehydrogenase E1 component